MFLSSDYTIISQNYKKLHIKEKKLLYFSASLLLIKTQISQMRFLPLFVVCFLIFGNLFVSYFWNSNSESCPLNVISICTHQLPSEVLFYYF